jgi:N-acetylmuramoyl-L-alanine amidase
MKKKILLFLCAIFIFVVPDSFGQYTQVVCIDPGHGGQGADKFHNGGDGYGGAGPVLGIAEQWVNYQVAWA